MAPLWNLLDAWHANVLPVSLQLHPFLTLEFDGIDRSISSTGKQSRYPLNSVDGYQSRSGGIGDEINLFPLLGFGHWTVQLVD